MSFTKFMNFQQITISVDLVNEKTIDYYKHIFSD